MGKTRVELIKGYLKRLGDGESLESVKADFVATFKDVESAEILKAEQEILAESTPLSEVQRLCDVHAALFHGMPVRHTSNAAAIRAEKAEKTKKLVGKKGHPLHLFTRENEALAKRLEDAKEEVRTGKADRQTILSIRDIAGHYAKKGDLLYPVLKVHHGISGPSDVMWTVDDEIRDEISRLFKMDCRDEAWNSALEDVIGRADDMIYKEENILFPNCAANFTEEEWIGIYHDMKDYAECFGVKWETWEEAEDRKVTKTPVFQEEEIVMPGGHMTVSQLTALLNTIPMEITFVDEENKNRYFNEGPKDFKRPGMAIGREVFSCHPPKVEEKVRKIVSQFREGTLDELPIWMEKNGKQVLVKYMAVRDKDKNYIGTLELVQDMEFAKEHFLGKK